MLFLLMIILLILSWQDWRTKQISAWLLIPFIWYAGLQYNASYLLFSLLIYIIALLINAFIQPIIGNGDLDILFVGSLYLPFHHWLGWLTISCLIVLALYPFLSNKVIPFVPFLTTGFILQTIWAYYV